MDSTYSAERAQRRQNSSEESCLFLVILTIITASVMITCLIAVASNARGSAYANSDCTLNAGYPHAVRQWCGLIMTNAQAASLPPDLVAALIYQESGGNPNAYSRSGAVGLMQVMPRDGLAADFLCKTGPCFQHRPTMNELYDPQFNIQYGTRYLRQLVDAHQGDVREALRDYGPYDVGYSYADTVLAIYQRYGGQ